jgi:hypothetical protein
MQKLDISNGDLFIMKTTEESNEIVHSKKEQNQKAAKDHFDIVMSFKSIGINTYNIIVLDLESQKIKYWHESYQLWESQVKGFLLSTNEFMKISKDGIDLLSLGNGTGRVVKDKDGFERYIHPLGACNYIKIEKNNHLKFACQFYDNRQIWLQDQYED